MDTSTAQPFQKRNDFMQIFTELSSIEDQRRSKAVSSLLRSLKNDEGKSESPVFSELEYTVKRLVNGMCSSRKCSRLGFTVALDHILQAFPAVDLTIVMRHLDCAFRTKGSMKENEIRDALLGKLMLCAVIVRRFDLVTPTNSDSTRQVINALLDIAERKSYLQQSAYKLVSDIILSSPGDLFRTTITPLISKYAFAGWNACTADTLVLVLAVEKKADSKLASQLQEAWGTLPICSPKNYKHIGRVLRSSTVFAHPHIHLAWDAVLDHVTKLGVGKLAKFHKRVVEDLLSGSSIQKACLGLNLVLKMVPHARTDQVSVIISESLLNLLASKLSRRSDPMLPFVTKFLSDLLAALRQVSEEARGIALSEFVSKPNFLLCHADTVKMPSALLEGCSPGKLVEVVRMLQKLGSGAEENSESLRKWTISAFLCIVKNKRVPWATQWLWELATFLLVHSFFTPIKLSSKLGIHTLFETGASAGVRQHCSVHFFSTISEVITASLDQVKNVKKPEGTGNNTNHNISVPVPCFQDHDRRSEVSFEVIAKLMSTVVQLLSKPKVVTSLISWDLRKQEAFSVGSEIITDLQQKQALSSSRLVSSMMSLTASCLFHLLNSGTIVDVIFDLKSCLDRMSGSVANDKELPWIDVLVELLVGLLSKESHVMRSGISMVFDAVVDQVTPRCVETLTRVLLPMEKGDDKFEMVSESEDSDDGLEDEEDKTPSDPLAVNLFSAGLDGSDMEDDLDMDALNEEDIQRLDHSLAGAIRMQQQRLRSRDHVKNEVIQIQHKCLDLVHILVKKSPNGSLLFPVIAPLFALSRLGGLAKYKLIARKSKTVLSLLFGKSASQFQLGGLTYEAVVSAAMELLSCLQRSHCKESCLLAARGLPFLHRIVKLCFGDERATSFLDVVHSGTSLSLQQVSGTYMTNFVKSLLCAMPELNGHIMTDIALALEVSKKMFQKCQLLEMFEYVLGKSNCTHKMEWKSCKAVYEHLVRVLSDPSNVSAKTHKHFGQQLRVLKLLVKKAMQVDKLMSVLDFEPIHALLADIVKERAQAAGWSTVIDLKKLLNRSGDADNRVDDDLPKSNRKRCRIDVTG